MTHPIVEAVAAKLREQTHGSPHTAHSPDACDYCRNSMEYDRKRAAELVAEVLRLAREPSAGVDRALTKSLGKMPAEGWRAGIDALRREVEEG